MTTALWSLRWSTAWGWRWIKERDCEATTAAEWLAQFQRIEPPIEFRIADRKPRAVSGMKSPITNLGFAA